MMEVPRRKPIPGSYTAAAPPAPQPQSKQPQLYTHSRTRTTSSNIFPTAPYQSAQPQYPTNMQVHAYTSRRTPSQATFSTASSGNAPLPARQPSHDLRRSTSSRSNASNLQPTSYVALMRKQKATVWCDRSQHEDPRMIAAQKAAKAKAAQEIIGGPARVYSNGTGKQALKVRQAGKANLVGYSPGALVGGVGGVPMRLSASEVADGDSDDDADSGNYGHHRRTGSGRSSLGSGRRIGLTYSRQSGAGSNSGRWSSGNTPPGERRDSMQDVDEAGETPVPGQTDGKKDYFSPSGAKGDGAQSVGSGSSGERADAVGELNNNETARLASNSLLQSTVTREKSVRNPEELRRRGSVDERTMTMSAGRLFIANPDSDSD